MNLPSVSVKVTGNYEVDVEVGGVVLDHPAAALAWPVSPVSTLAEAQPIYRLPDDWVCRPCTTPLSEVYDWSLEFTGIPKLWAETRGEGLKVCVLDTGVDAQHPDLKRNLKAAFDFTGSLKGIREGRVRCRFVAVTCHYDVAEWLAPDFLVDMASGECQRRSLRRPAIELEIFRCRRRTWSLFARHHYLSGSLSARARCHLALWRGTPVAFCATLPLIGRRGHWRISRIVTLPDYQGIGIGMRVAEAVAQLHRDLGLRVNVTASHPALLAHCQRSPRWRLIRMLKSGSASARRFKGNYRSSAGRAVVSFEYLGEQGKDDERRVARP